MEQYKNLTNATKILDRIRLEIYAEEQNSPAWEMIQDVKLTIFFRFKCKRFQYS